QGIDVGRLSTISYGKEKPVAEGGDEAAHAQNRRAVTVVMGR
ncbi:MAG: peptidoglycan-associated lipoprotein Pal, partial [Pseudomonadota bacterium]